MKKHWKFILLILVGVGIWLMVPRLIGVEEAARALRNTYWPYILLAVLCEFLSYASIAALSKNILRAIKAPLSYQLALKLGFLNAFAIHVLPVGALGASSLDYFFLKRLDMQGGKIILLIILRTTLIYIGLLILLIGSSIFTQFGQKIPFSQLTMLYGIVFLGILVLFYLIYLYKNAPLYFKRMSQISGAISRFVSKVQGGEGDPLDAKSFSQDLHFSAKLFTAAKKDYIFSQLLGVTYWLGDLFCLYFVLLSLGYTPNIAVLVFGYVVAFIFSIVSFIPGGVGVIEVTLGLIYISFGMPIAIASIGILIFRFLSFWLIIPVGAVSFVNLTKSIPKAPLEIKDSSVG